MELLIAWVTEYGYIAIFGLLMFGIVGLPIPDETLLVFCGYLISKGALSPVAAWATALTGSICGITLSYFLGRRFGLSLIQKYGKYLGFTPERLDQVLKRFDRLGPWTLIAGYFLAGFRHFTALVAGTSGLQWPVFAVFAYSGALLWVTTFLAIGYLVGENWQTMAAQVQRYLGQVTLGLTLSLAAVFSVRWWMKRRSGSNSIGGRR